MYAQDTSGTYVLGELLVGISNGSVQLTLKCQDAAKAEGAKEIFAKSIKNCVDSLF